MKEVKKIDDQYSCLGSFEEDKTNATIPWGTLLEKMKARKPCADKVTPGDQGILTLKAITDYSTHQNANGNTIKEPVYTEDNPVTIEKPLNKEIGISDFRALRKQDNTKSKFKKYWGISYQNIENLVNPSHPVSDGEITNESHTVFRS